MELCRLVFRNTTSRHNAVYVILVEPIPPVGYVIACHWGRWETYKSKDGGLGSLQRKTIPVDSRSVMHKTLNDLVEYRQGRDYVYQALESKLPDWVINPLSNHYILAAPPKKSAAPAQKRPPKPKPEPKSDADDQTIAAFLEIY